MCVCVCVQVTDCGGNALLAYQTQFDMEDNFIIARGIGTAVTLDRESLHTATHCKTLQHTTTHCNTLQQILALEVPLIVSRHTLQQTATYYDTLQHTAIDIGTAVAPNRASPHTAAQLPHTAKHCNKLQSTTTNCNTCWHCSYP